MSLRISDIGEPIDWASTGMVFKHKHENKVIKIMPRVPSRFPKQYIQRKLEDEKWMITFGWTYLQSDAITKFWRSFMDSNKQAPAWLPKVYEAGSSQLNYETMWNLVDSQVVKSTEGMIPTASVSGSDELLSVFTSARVSRVPVNYIIMEYLPENANELEEGEKMTWQAEIHDWFWTETGHVVRDMVANEDNYLRRGDGQLVFFDPVVSQFPQPGSFRKQDTMVAMNFREAFCSYGDYDATYDEYYTDLQCYEDDGEQICQGFDEDGSILLPYGYNEGSPESAGDDYLTHEWYRADEPSLDDYTTLALMNSNVIGNNWSSNVQRYA